MKCPVCKNSLFSFSFTKNGYDIVRCKRCRMLQVDTSKEAFQAKEYYKMYFNGETGDYSDYFADKEAKYRNFRMYLSFIEQYIKPPGRLLEVGAAFGFFLEIAMETWDVEAVEISSSGCSFMQKKYNFPVFEGSIEDIELPQNNYDVITSFDCIEHVERPDRFAKKAFNLLKPGGWLFISTLDSEAWLPRIRGKKWRQYLPPSHLFYFSSRTLRMLLERMGFQTIAIKRHSIYRALKNSVLYGVLYRGKPKWKQYLYNALSPYVPNTAIKIPTGDLIFMCAKKPE